MEKQGCIYKIENLVNGKVYIGQTVQKFNRRMKQHLSLLRRGKHDNIHLQSAWNKYGESSFFFSIEKTCYLTELDQLEVELINHYTMVTGSYNLESGGNKNKSLSLETRNKIAKATKSQGWIGGKHPQAKKVICINNEKIYDSIIEASNELGINYANLHQVLLKVNNSVRGIDGVFYQFDYFEVGKEYKLKNLKNIKTPKRVICVNTGKLFNSTREAAEKTGVNQSKISNCCNGKRNFAGRMSNGDWIKWVFEDDYDPNKEYSFKRIRIQTEEIRKKISLTHKEKRKREHAK